jgi:hypothetical protein
LKKGEKICGFGGLLLFFHISQAGIALLFVRPKADRAGSDLRDL